MPEIRGKKSVLSAAEALQLKAKASRFHESRMVKSQGIYPYVVAHLCDATAIKPTRNLL